MVWTCGGFRGARVERPRGLARGPAVLVATATVGANLTPGDLGLLLLLPAAAGEALAAAALVAAARLLPVECSRVQQHAARHSVVCVSQKVTGVAKKGVLEVVAIVGGEGAAMLLGIKACFKHRRLCSDLLPHTHNIPPH